MFFPHILKKLIIFAADVEIEWKNRLSVYQLIYYDFFEMDVDYLIKRNTQSYPLFHTHIIIIIK